MSTPLLITAFVAVFAAIAVAIVRLRLNPAIALLLGAVVLGLITGQPLAELPGRITDGFGSLMAEVGLLIALGVVMGSLMTSYGAVQRIVESIVRLFGRRGSPYAFALTLSTITPAIYFDVLLLLVAPIARGIARRTGRSVASLAGAVATGLAAGNALVVPGTAMLAYAGAVHVPLSAVIVPGFAVAVPAVALATLVFTVLTSRRWGWNERDEDPTAAFDDDVTAGVDTAAARRPSLPVALAPIVVTLALIIADVVAAAAGVDSAVLGFVGSPVVALLAGVLTALGIVVVRRGPDTQERRIGQALETAGTILVVTAVAGSLGAVIEHTGMHGALEQLLDANAAVPLLVVWTIAAVLRAAIGGQTVAGVTAIGVIAPLVGDLGLSPALVVLAAGAGGCFGGQFSDNAFWMFRSLFGLSTRGALKAYTGSQSLLSLITLAIVVGVSVLV